MSDGTGRIFRRGHIWWIDYGFRGQRYRESSGSRRKTDAKILLRRRMEEMGRGRLVGRDEERLTFEDLATAIETDYVNNDRKSLDRLQLSLGHLRRYFGRDRALDISANRITKYIKARKEEGAANATINKELAAIRRAFSLAVKQGLVTSRPHVATLSTKNVRKGFFEAYQFAPVLAELPDHLKALAEVGYLTGWRKGELLSRRWRHIDFEDGWLRLDPGETKNGEGRNFPLIPPLRSVLLRQHARKLEVEERTGRPVTALFFYDDGRPIKDFRGAWKSACVAAGFWKPKTDDDGRPVRDRKGRPEREPTFLFHDLRRTAARNLVRSGIPAIQAKEFTGHLTLSVFERYCIKDEVTMQEAGAKYAAHLGTAQFAAQSDPVSEPERSREEVRAKL